MEELGLTQDPEEWRLFVDESKQRLKAVLLHNIEECGPISG
jgi:hypothetical protein